MATTPPTRVSDLARRWRVDIDTATYPASSYNQLLGISDLKPNFAVRTAPDEMYEDDGADRVAVTGSSWELAVTMSVSTNAAGTSRDAVQAFLFAQHLAHVTGGGPTAEFGVKVYDRNGIASEAFEGRAIITAWGPSGGQNKDDITMTLKGQGKLTAITNPASSQSPVVTGLSDTAGAAAGGEIVMVYGHHFTGVTNVDFGATAATDYEFLSDGVIAAIAPAHAAGTVQVKVTTAIGASANTAADDYVYS